MKYHFEVVVMLSCNFFVYILNLDLCKLLLMLLQSSTNICFVPYYFYGRVLIARGYVSILRIHF